ncbi:MAG: hypothetical protein KC535_03685 [Nanoarchaeota archaeon]|nr:hypothetical protein [Nanoarchaeota archaeon]
MSTKKTLLSIIAAGLWITFFEFLRNELVFKQYWVRQFSSLGLIFETTPLNGILWTVWSLLLAFLIFKLLEKFSLKESVILSWLPSFLMMWIVAYNLQVLPLLLLVFAVPLSLFEVFIAAKIIKAFSKK